MRTDTEAIDLIEAEEEAERDILKEREDALAKELAEMRQKKKKLVDPIQYALSIAAEDLTNYDPTFSWEMAPPSEKQLAFLERRGISAEHRRECRTRVSLDRQAESAGRTQASLPPKQIRCLERYGFSRLGPGSFDDAGALISADSRITTGALPYWVKPETYRP